MKTNISIIKGISICALFSLSFSACSDILNLAPISTIDPKQFFVTESQLCNYVDELYSTSPFPTHGSQDFGTFAIDNNTDNICDRSSSSKYLPGEWKVGQSGGNWYFSNIYKYNYFLTNAGERWENHMITGSDANIKQYFGEVYVFRAYEYFQKVQEFGDFPIITETLENEMETLTLASKRAPRTEVIKFILSDLDKAISYLQDNPGGYKTRISKYAAYMLKSRVALFEATWMKYFKGTAFVPGGKDWPGATKEYNKGYEIQDYDALTDSLFQVCMDASKIVAERFPLTPNNGVLQQTETDSENPYMTMFSSVDLSDNTEVIFWRQYSRAMGVCHSVCQFAQTGGQLNGLTRGFVDNFLLENGKPIYADSELYAGDDYIADVRKNRDNRLQLFLKEPGQSNLIFNKEGVDRAQPIEGYPNVTSSNREAGYGTGYALRKGGTFDGEQLKIIYGCYTGSIIFRSAEAFLNYMEACCEKNNGILDETARNYWRQLRERAKINPDYSITVNATVMDKEMLNDWGACSAGKPVSAILYNIRRERRCELMAEGLRMSDLKRWRALDQLIETPYHIEGFKLWGPMKNWYVDNNGNSTLKYGVGDANVSAPEASVYFRPQEINPNSLILKQGGCKWAMAHYLSPIAIQHMLITSDDRIDVSTSPIYQNPYWPTVADEGAQK